ncbi:NAD(P)-dependent oxidoreductase [Deinococcus frigens]|uniref:NAD(P)-dependent oxidoreductase n=1 Tax=Deinococcus frigens TaxID=249403 RepID=UPI000A40122A|nr:NAD(P)H-binding protein [Deinococcus frigens]
MTQTTLTLAILGGTGRTGRLLIDQALDQNYSLRVLARDPSKLHRQDERLELVQGDAMNAADIERLLTGSDVVLSALGQTKGGPNELLTRAAELLTQQMPQHGVRRLITLVGAGVPFPGDTPKLVDKVFRTLLKVLQPAVLNDAEAHAELIRASSLDWTIVRGPMLTEGSAVPLLVGRVGEIRPRVTRASVAQFMLAQVSSDQHVGQAPAISN